MAPRSRTALWCLALCLACLVSPALAKVETGTVKLDSATTEQLIGRFGVTEKGSLTLKLTTAKKGWELNGYLIAVAWFVATVGPGRWSVDHALDLDLTGIVVGLLALTVGVGGGTVQWRSRSTDRGPSAQASRRRSSSRSPGSTPR